MNRLYKLTDEYGRTRNGTQWGEGVTHKATGAGAMLHSDQVIHAHEYGPELPLLLNPNHPDFSNPRLWLAEGRIVVRSGRLRCGVKSLTTIREIDCPEITTEHRIRFAILSARVGCSDTKWRAWATDWLSGKDRSADAARRAARVAGAAEWAAGAAAVSSEWWAASAAYEAAVGLSSEWWRKASAAAAVSSAVRAGTRSRRLNLDTIAKHAMDLGYMPEHGD